MRRASILQRQRVLRKPISLPTYIAIFTALNESRISFETCSSYDSAVYFVVLAMLTELCYQSGHAVVGCLLITPLCIWYGMPVITWVASNMIE